MIEAPTSEDVLWLNQVMGRNLRGDYKIARRDAKGRPLVLQVPPIVDGKPFPSLYWLCGPGLKKQIDHLEARGTIKELEQEIPHNPELKESLKQDHLRYQQEREKLLVQQLSSLSEDHQPSPAMLSDLKLKGIGGLENWERIRCLHMHYAYHLVTRTYLGALLDQRYDLSTWASQ